jgi:hypothetical protein
MRGIQKAVSKYWKVHCHRQPERKGWPTRPPHGIIEKFEIFGDLLHLHAQIMKKSTANSLLMFL